MKTIFGLLLVGLVASVSATIAPIKLVPGQSYIYAYSGKLISGIAEFESSAALMEMKCDIVMQEEQDSHIAMQMMNIRVGKQNGPKAPQGMENVVLDHQSEPQYEEELSKPIRFYWDNGQIKNFEADRNESEWSVNIKKSILSLLNINLAPQMTMDDDWRKMNGFSGSSSDQQKMAVYPVYEDGINGICETLYQVISAADYRWIPSQTDNVQVFNMTKTRNYGNCLRQSGTDRQSTADIRGAPVVCAQGHSYPLVPAFNSLSGHNYKLGGCQHYQPTETVNDFAENNAGLYSFVKYNITAWPADNSSRIDSIYGQGKTVHQTKGKQLVLVAEQNITLVEVIPTTKIGPIQQIRNIMLYEDLSYRIPETKDQLEIPFYQLYGPIDKQELQELIPALLGSVAKDIESNEVETSKNTMQKIVQLVNAIAVLDVQQLHNVFEQVAAQQGVSYRATTHQRMIRKLFLDLLSYAGTSDAVFFAKQLYEQDQISAFEAKEVFESIPQNLFRIDGKVVQAYLDLFLSDKVQDEQNLASSVGIAFGKLIREATLKREQSTNAMREDDEKFMNGIVRTTPWYDDWTVQKTMDEGQISQVLRLLREALKSCSTFQQKVTLIETLAHAGTSQALSLLAPYVKNEVSYEELPGYPVGDEQNVDQERNFIRQVTIYALTHIASNESNHAQVLSLLMPIFRNKFEPYEVRIAAFTVMLTCHPDRVMLEQICSEMHQESNRQVRSFVVSALKTVAKFSDPNTHKLADDARFALGFAPQDHLGMQYSKMMGHNYYDDEKKYGMNVMVEWVANNVSQIPRSGYVAVRESDGDWQNVLLEVGYNAKGIDSIIKRLAQSDTLINLINGEEGKTLKRETKSSKQKEESVRLIKEKLPFNVRNEEELKATVFMKIFEQTSYYSFDRQQVEQLIDSAEGSIKQITNQLKQGQDYHYIKLLMLKQKQQVVFSEIGLPVMVTERNPTIVSVKANQAKLQMNPSSKSMLPESANFSVQVEPSVYHTSFNFVFGILPISIEAIGTYVERSSRVSAPVAISAGYRRVPQQFQWSVTPKVSQEILHHQTEAVTFIAKAKIASSPDHQWISDAKQIRTQNSPYRYEQEYFKKELGIGMRLQVSTENVYAGQPWYQSKTAQKYGPLAAFLELINNHQMTPCTVHLMLESDEQNPVTGYEMSVRYKKVHVNDDDDSNDGGDDDDDDDNNEGNDGVDTRKHLHRMGSRQSSSMIKKMVQDMVTEWNQESAETQTDDKADLVAHSLQLIVESQSIQPTIYTAQFLVAHRYDQKVYYATVQGVSQDSARSVNGQLCMNSIMVYPNAPSDFYYEDIAVQDLKAMIQSRIDFGQDCQSGSHVAMKALMKTGEKQQEGPFYGEQTDQTQKSWFYQQCHSDRENGQPTSYACQRALIEDSYFKQIAMEVTYQNLDDKISNVTYKVASAAKVAFYHHMDENQLVQNEANKVGIDGYYYTKFENYPMVDVYVHAPEQNVWFEKVVVPYFRPMSAYLPTVKVYENLLKGYQPEERCTMMEDYVRTFDNVSMVLPDSQCQYLLAKDCSESEIFTIYGRQLDVESKTKEATVIVQGKEIVLTPPSSQSTAEIKIDGKVVELQASQAEIMFGGQMKVYLRETSSPNTSPIVVVEHDQHKLKVLYDGKNIQVKLGSQYKGETCGICGDDNHESDGEFIGPDLCEYEQAEDFINSYAVIGSPECPQVPETQGAKYCGEKRSQTKQYNVKENGPLSKLKDEWNLRKKSNSIRQMNDHRSWSEGLHRRGLNQQQQQQHTATATDGSNYHRMVNAAMYAGASAAQKNQIQRMRTLAIQKNDRLCFSVQPILTCIEGVSRPYQVQQQMLGFHCLPAQSISAKKLAEQSQYQVLEIFGKKQIDFAAPIQVPVSCQTV